MFGKSENWAPFQNSEFKLFKTYIWLMKKLVFICLFTFLFNLSKAQCDWVFTNCIDCERTIEFCWVDGGAPVCTTFVLQPGCMQDCSEDTFALPSQFCSGSGTYYMNLISRGSISCTNNCNNLANGPILCCDQDPISGIFIGCVDECQCARLEIDWINYRFSLTDLSTLGVEPCPRNH